MADKLRKNIDAAEYKHVVLGLIFLRYISEAFAELYNKLKRGQGEYAGADPEDKDEYKAENVYFFTCLLINHVVDELQSSVYGSVFDTITTTTFKENIITIPTESEIREFNASVSPYFKKILKNQKQINTLENLRDTLLPKLMSGEVRIEI